MTHCRFLRFILPIRPTERNVIRYAQSTHGGNCMSTLTETPPARDERAASILEDQVAAYKRDGFVIMEDLLQGVELERVQAAFERA